MHGIMKNDRLAGIQLEWHRKNDVMSQEDMNDFDKGPLNYKVKSELLYLPDGSPAVETILARNEETEELEEIERPFQAIVSDGAVLSIMRETYPIIQNREIWETFEILIQEYGFNCTFAGSIYGRKQIFWTLENGDTQNVGGKDPIQNRLVIVSSQDSSLRTMHYNSAFRVVCANTLNASIAALFKRMKQLEKESTKDVGFVSMLKKTKNVSQRLANVKHALIAHENERQATMEIFEELAASPIDWDKAANFTTGFLANGKLSTKAKSQVDSVVDLFRNGKGNEGKTKWDLLNGFTEFFTHGATENKEKAFLSSEFGSYAKRKSNAFETLLDDEAIDKLASKGEKLLREYELAR